MDSCQKLGVSEGVLHAAPEIFLAIFRRLQRRCREVQFQHAELRGFRRGEEPGLAFPKGLRFLMRSTQLIVRWPTSLMKAKSFGVQCRTWSKLTKNTAMRTPASTTGTFTNERADLASREGEADFVRGSSRTSATEMNSLFFKLSMERAVGAQLGNSGQALDSRGAPVALHRQRLLNMVDAAKAHSADRQGLTEHSRDDKTDVAHRLCR